MSEYSYKTVYEGGVGEIEEKKSRFIATVIPIESEEEAVDFFNRTKKKYWDARHNCSAFTLGRKHELTRCNDDGEPSSTAGKPILGQINSNDLTYILIIVVRYYGGVNLGTGGLIVAYKTAAAAAIDNSEVEVRQVEELVKYDFPYVMMNDVMRVVKDMQPRIVKQEYDNTCSITLSIRKSEAGTLRGRLSKLSFE